MKVQVKVPATSANMGSGYDSIGIALDLYNTITFEECDRIDISDVNGQDIPTDESNLIYQCAKKIYDICGKPLNGVRTMSMLSGIPDNIDYQDSLIITICISYWIISRMK